MVQNMCEGCIYNEYKEIGVCLRCYNGSSFRKKGTIDYSAISNINGMQIHATKTEIISETPLIKKVIFNKPATIVFWYDGTKTIVKVQGKSRFDKEKGLAMAISKKMLGNNGNYYNEFKKWIE